MITLRLMRPRVYRLARNAYQRVLNREHWRHRERERELYRPFIAPGTVAFDVGANLGHVSETLLELGARVVAVEANPELAKHIRRHYGDAVVVEAMAAGESAGEATLTLGRDNGHSTLSTDWKERAPTADRWLGEIVVRVGTLDELVERYGVPAFIKIDVEGYEASVLRGLSTPVRALSFEFQCAYLESLESCLERLVGLNARYTFAVKPAGTWTLEWGDADQVRRAIAQLPADHYGDVFVRADPSTSWAGPAAT